MQTEIYIAPYGSKISPKIQVLVVAGGGGGGGSNNDSAGGGGGGGVIADLEYSLNPLTATYPVVIGAGGAAGATGPGCTDGGNGANSTFDAFTAIGGGGGGAGFPASTKGDNGKNGGSGGGGGGNHTTTNPAGIGGFGTPGQGYPGGNGIGDGAVGGSGGGGGAGESGAVVPFHDGADGITPGIAGSITKYGGGGGGAPNGTGIGVGGAGGGGNTFANGTANTGGGGGGSFGSAFGHAGPGAGGSGIVIIAYRTNGYDGIDPSSTGGTKTTVGDYTVHTFTANGTFTPVYITDLDLFFQLDVRVDLPMPHSKSIIDITSLEGGPGELLGGGSKTITLPGTKNNNEILGFIFEINLTDASFNVSRKSNIRVYQDKLQIIDGILKLENINITEDYIEYECQITDGVSNFYKAMQVPDGNPNGGNASELTDLDFSDLNHTYDWSHISASWTATLGAGYVYPMIDYGQNDLHGWWVNQFFPAIYVKEYLDRIFKFCGFTYSSNFLTNTSQPAGRVDFKRLIVPCNDALVYTQAEVDSRQFNVQLSADQITGFAASPWRIHFDTTIFDNTPPIYDTTNHIATIQVAKPGTYIFTAKFTVVDTGTGDWLADMARNGVSVPVTQIFHQGSRSVIIQIPSTFYIAGETIEVRLSRASGNLKVLAGAEFYDIYDNRGIVEGDSMTLNSAVPTGIKMQVFFKSICKMFNLHIEADPTNFYNLVIEPYDDFYNGSLLDWTKKWDRSKQGIITPMGKLNSKNYLFTYTADNDYHNSLYSNLYYTLDHQDIYGERQISTENDYATDNHKTDIIFAPTPLVFYYFITNQINNKILSTVHMGSSKGNDPTNQADHSTHIGGIAQSNIRILFYGGLKSGDWELTEATGTVHTETQFPYAGHIDDPFSPTIDINFGVPAQLFYQLTGVPYTTNNLFNAYYSAFMAEITDPESKVVELYVKLTAADIISFSFRNIVLIDKTYYKVLEITDYDLGIAQVTKVTLLKSKTHPPVSVGQIGIGGSGTTGGGMAGEALPKLNSEANVTYLQAGSMVGIGGQGNQISPYASNILITGDNNIVSGDSQNIAIHGGSGNIVYGSNLTLINCVNQTISDNNAVYVNNVKYVPVAPLSTLSGQATLGTDGGGIALVSFVGVTTASIIVVTGTGTGTLGGFLTVTAGTGSFTIQSSVITDNDVVNWFIVAF